MAQSNSLRNLLASVALLGAAHSALGIEAWDSAKLYAEKAMLWKHKPLTSVSFKKVFPKAIYKKSYFGLGVTGVTIVGACAFSYFTAGAGAPVAATGVSTVASWVAGGGAGSYMAGLSTIGGVFGGNAMLGSAILNGISIGVIGGGPAFATLPALAKAGVIASVAASTLDGVAVLQKPHTTDIMYRIRLVVPDNLGSTEIRQLTKQLHDAEEQLLEKSTSKDEKNYRTLHNRKEALLKEAVIKAGNALNNGASNEDLLVLSIITKNSGRPDLFDKLLSKILLDKVQDTGYLDYLKAVSSIERGDSKAAISQLRKSWRLNSYAIEQPLLLINILGNENFEYHEEEMRAIVEKSRNDFDSDKYESGYSIVSLDYRLATMYLRNKKYSLAQFYYKQAYDELSLMQQHFGDQSIRHLINLGIANAMYGQSKKSEAQELVQRILKDIETDDEKSVIRSQYAGNI